MIDRAGGFLYEAKMKIFSTITILVIFCCLEVAFGYPSRSTRARGYLPYDDGRYAVTQGGITQQF